MTEVLVQLSSDFLVLELFSGAARRDLLVGLQSLSQGALVCSRGTADLLLPLSGGIFVFELSRVWKLLWYMNE